jgi:hypothetical protein
MARDAAIRELRAMVVNGELDGSLVELLIQNYDEIKRIRETSQAKSVEEYEKFRAALA